VKFGILSQWFDPEPGSAAVPGVLARALVERGHQVQVVTGFPNYPTGKVADGYRIRWRHDEAAASGPVAGPAVRRVALYPSHDRSAWRRLANYGSFALSASAAALPALRGADAVWVYNSPATVGLPSALASAGGGPPHLMHVLDLWPDSIAFSGLAGGRAYARMAPLLERWCAFTYRQAAAIACISRGTLDQLKARGVPPAKLHYVPVWTNEHLHRPRDRDTPLAEALGVADSFVVLYAGNLGDAQGLDGLVEACARLGDLPRLRCLVAGSGTAEGRLRARAERLRLTNLTFLGRWPAADMGGLMSIGDVHVVSLNDHPLASITMPSKLPATLASGRAVCAVATGETARVVEHAGAGWTVPPGDPCALAGALRAAYAMGREGTAEVGGRARRYYEAELALDRGVDTIEGLLTEMAAASGRRRERAA
jgi:glycosyltransferase involved in cell wall biosynthesis